MQPNPKDLKKLKAAHLFIYSSSARDYDTFWNAASTVISSDGCQDLRSPVLTKAQAKMITQLHM
jgi:hypothetical protein